MELNTKKNKKFRLFFIIGIVFLVFIFSIEFVDAIKIREVKFTKGLEPTKPWKKTVDAISVVDVSESMRGIRVVDGKSLGSKIDEAKSATKFFIDIVLKNPKSNLGLVAYSYWAVPKWGHNLSNDNVSLKKKVDEWVAHEHTCICCGVLKAIEYLNDSNTTNSKMMVVMSDGHADIECKSIGTRNATLDAIESAKIAWEDYGIKVYTIGFGNQTDEVTLKAMANAGNGSYYYAELGELEKIYARISERNNLYIDDDLYDLQSGKERTLWAKISEKLSDFFNSFKKSEFIQEDYRNEIIREELVVMDGGELEPLSCCSGLCGVEGYPTMVSGVNEDGKLSVVDGITGVAVGIESDIIDEDSISKKKVIELVREAGYSVETAEEFYEMISGWENAMGENVFENLEKDLIEKRKAYELGEISLDTFVNVEFGIIYNWANIIRWELKYKEDVFDLDSIKKDKLANCLGYSQIMYFTGRAIGLDVSIVRLDTITHVINIIKFSDGKFVLFDLATPNSENIFSDSKYEIGIDGWEYYGKNDIKKGNIILDILDSNEFRSSINFARAEVNFRNLEFDSAIKYYDKAEEDNPEDKIIYNNRGIVKMYNKMKNESIQDLDKAIELDPEYIRAYVNKGNTYLYFEDYEKAVIHYTKAIEIDSNSYKSYFGRSYANLMLKKYEKTINDCFKSLLIKEGNARCYYNLGIAYAYLGEKDKAKLNFKNAESFNPNMEEDVKDISKKFGIELD